MAPAAPSRTSCADSNTIGGLRTHYQRIVFGTTPGHLTLRGPSTDVGCLSDSQKKEEALLPLS
jgi:hypothetical protein